MRRAALGLLLGTACAAVAAPGALGDTAYVAVKGADAVTPVNTASGFAGTPITVGSEPWGIAVTPDGRTAYVADHGAENVTPIDLETGVAETAIAAGAGPTEIAIAPNGRTAYVCDQTAGTVTPIDLETNTPEAPIQVGGSPTNIAITPDGSTAYVVNAATNNVTPIDLASATAGTPISVGEGPTGIAITADGRTAYVSNYTAGTVTPITLATNTPLNPITVGEHPENLAASLEGPTVYVALYGGSVIPIDSETNLAGTPMPGGTDPGTLALTPDGKTLLLGAIGGSSISALSLGSGVLGSEITVGSAPYQIAFAPDQAPTARFTAAAAPAGSPSVLDASAASAAQGTITNYRWSFGDGQVGESSTPTVTHTYAVPGSYTVTLTVTDSDGTSTSEVFAGQEMAREGGPQAQVSAVVPVPASVPGSPPPHTPGHRPRRPLHVSVPARSLTLSRGGWAVVQVSCPAEALGGCHGSVTITHPVTSTRAHRSALAFAAQCTRGCRKLGHSKYEARAGQTVNVRVHIASVGRTLLLRKRVLHVRVTITNVSAAQTSTTALTLALRAPGARRLASPRRAGQAATRPGERDLYPGPARPTRASTSECRVSVGQASVSSVGWASSRGITARLGSAPPMISPCEAASTTIAWLVPRIVSISRAFPARSLVTREGGAPRWSSSVSRLDQPASIAGSNPTKVSSITSATRSRSRAATGCPRGATTTRGSSRTLSRCTSGRGR